jgi:hypothetical protein
LGGSREGLLFLAESCLPFYAVGHLCETTATMLANQDWIKNRFRNEK